MANISGTNVAAKIAPFTTEDTYATHVSTYGQGGWHEVTTTQERDAIPADRRIAGMAVLVTSESKLYTLNTDLTTWTEFESGGVDDVLVNGASVVENKIAEITVPTNNNQLINGAGYITSASLPTVNNGTLDIQVNGTSIGTFTANQAGNTTANIVVPDSATWGNITGTLSNQTDLQNVLDLTLQNKSTTAETSFVDTKAGTASYPTDGSNLTYSLVIGKGSYFSGLSSASYDIIIGYGAHCDGSYNIAIGGSTYGGHGANNVTLGYNAQATTNRSVAVGDSARATAADSVSVGYNARTTGQLSVAIGHNSYTANNYTTAVGAATTSNYQYSTSVGYNSTSTGASSVEIGASAKAGNYSVAIGRDAIASNSSSVQLGQGTNSNYGSLQFRNWQLLNNEGKIPEERLPDNIKTATPKVPNLYIINQDKVTEQSILYTGVTNGGVTNSMFYRGRLIEGHPTFSCTYVDNDWIDSYQDVYIDQQKLFTKLAEVSLERVDNDDIENSIFGGANSEQSIYLYYDADNDYYLIRFDNDSFESAFNHTPDDITGLSFEDFADYGIYINNFHKPEDVEGEYEFCDIYYYAPVYCDSYGWNDSPSYINYFNLVQGLNDSDYGIGVILGDVDEWSINIDNVDYYFPLIPEYYEWNDSEYDNIEFYWEWSGEEWDEYINGENIGYSWSTSELYSTFGIYVEEGEEVNVEYITLNLRGGVQRYWEQFNPIDTSTLATKQEFNDLSYSVRSIDDYKVFKRIQNDRDLNTMTTAGQYRIEAVSCTNLPTNAANSRFMWLFVSNYLNDSQVRQVLITDYAKMVVGASNYARYAPNIFVRCKINNIWSGWKPLLTDECSPWITGFDKDKTQFLIHTASNNTMLWQSISAITGYNSSENQVLTHDSNGNLKWVTQ